jgi:hypothetical protein
MTSDAGEVFGDWLGGQLGTIPESTDGSAVSTPLAGIRETSDLATQTAPTQTEPGPRPHPSSDPSAAFAAFLSARLARGWTPAPVLDPDHTNQPGA